MVLDTLYLPKRKGVHEQSGFLRLDFVYFFFFFLVVGLELKASHSSADTVSVRYSQGLYQCLVDKTVKTSTENVQLHLEPEDSKRHWNWRQLQSACSPLVQSSQGQRPEGACAVYLNASVGVWG